MARYTDRYGLSYFGGAVPGNITEDGSKFTLFDPPLLDSLLGAMEDHDHSGGERLLDPADAPTMDLREIGGSLPAGRTYHYAVTFVDRFGLETVPSDEVDVVTPAPVQPPISPSVDPEEGTATVTVTLTADSKTVRIHEPDPATTSTTATTSTCEICDTPVKKEAGDWKHTNPDVEFSSKDVGRAISIVAGGANNITLSTTIKTVTNATTATLDVAPAVSGRREMDIERGGLPNEYHQYALSVLVYARLTADEGQAVIAQVVKQETTLSVPVPVTPPANGIVTITLPEMPEGGDMFRVWRKSIRDSAFTKIGTVGPENTFIDDGSVVADPCACTPENMPPATNTTNGTNSVVITVADLDQDTLNDSGIKAKGWRLYRTETSGVYGSRSLVAEIPRAANGTLPVSYIDTGEDLLPGRPPLVSNTILPSQPLAMAHGDLPALPNADLRLWTPWLTPDNQLYILTSTNNVQAWKPVRAEGVGDGQAVRYLGDWSGDQDYQASDLVSRDGVLYLAKQAILRPQVITEGEQALADVALSGTDLPATRFYLMEDGDNITAVAERDAVVTLPGVEPPPVPPPYISVIDTPPSPFALGTRAAFGPAVGSDAVFGGVFVAGDTVAGSYFEYFTEAFTENGWNLEGRLDLAGNPWTLKSAGAYIPTGQSVPTQVRGTAPMFFTAPIHDILLDVQSPVAGNWSAFLGWSQEEGTGYQFTYNATTQRLSLHRVFKTTAPGASVFDPAQWIALDGGVAEDITALDARLDSLEAAPAPDLTAILARLDALEASTGRDDTALHYRGVYDAGAIYLPNDLAVQAGQLYLTPTGQAAGAFEPGAWEVFPPS